MFLLQSKENVHALAESLKYEIKYEKLLENWKKKRLAKNSCLGVLTRKKKSKEKDSEETSKRFDDAAWHFFDRFKRADDSSDLEKDN